MNVRALILRLLGYRTKDEIFADLNRGGRPRPGYLRRDLARARKLELALLPRSTTFPREGEVWEAMRDVEVLYHAWYHAPGSATGRAVLPMGERVVCRSAQGRCISASFDPVRYAELHDRIVEPKLRTRSYAGTYNLWIKTSELNQHFRRVEAPPGRSAGEA